VPPALLDQLLCRRAPPRQMAQEEISRARNDLPSETLKLFTEFLSQSVRLSIPNRVIRAILQRLAGRKLRRQADYPGRGERAQRFQLVGPGTKVGLR